VLIPLDVTYRGFTPTEADRRAVAQAAHKLDRYYDRIMAARVIAEIPHCHHRGGRHYRVRIDLTIPGAELVVGRDPAECAGHESLRVAAREAFEDARRRLQDQVRISRHKVKRPVRMAEGVVVELHRAKDHGFIAAADGRRLYFHRNSVLDDGFQRLSVGTPVRFAEEEGERGPQASTVAIHHPSRAVPRF
jgi:cold shock CspA family protein